MYSGEITLDDCPDLILLPETCCCWLSETVGALKVITIQCYFKWMKLELNTR